MKALAAILALLMTVACSSQPPPNPGGTDAGYGAARKDKK